jgi:hypothetical protein
VLTLEQEALTRSAPPYPLSPDSLFVAYDAPAALGCHLALGWPLPARVLDLRAEFRCLTAGLEVPKEDDLRAALTHFQLPGEGLEALLRLLEAMLPRLDLPNALQRGRYTAAVARMEAVGVPIDTEAFGRLRERWEDVQDTLIKQVDEQYRVFDDRKFNPRRWQAWVNKNQIRWPRLAPGRLDLKLETFRDMAAAYPEVRPMKDLRASLSQLRLFKVAVGADGRNRCPLRPFVSKTGRNQPRSSEFIFGPAAWLRSLIKPTIGMALAYVDYEQQEFGIAAALSKDEAMMAAYESGDPYLAFAKQAEAVPDNATKATHRDDRERFKHCALGVQCGMQALSLAARLGVDRQEAQRLLDLHRATYAAYWQWSKGVGQQARRDDILQTASGWTLHLGPKPNPRSVRNFPLQAHGADMLRLACCRLTEAGVRVCAPVHDALLIEAPAKDIQNAVAACEQEMQMASEAVLGGFALRTEAKVVAYPGRYMDERGRGMWKLVSGMLADEGADTNGRSSTTTTVCRLEANTGPIFLGAVNSVGSVCGGGVSVGCLGGGSVPSVICPVSRQGGRGRVVGGSAPGSYWVDGKFVRGPVPLDWICQAGRLPGKALHVGVAVWYLAGRSGRWDNLPLTTCMLKDFGVQKDAKSDALRALELTGLLRVGRRGKKNPFVTILGVGACPGSRLGGRGRVVSGSAPALYLVDGKFVRGTLPLEWICLAGRLPGKALHVGSALWYLAGRYRRLDDIFARNVHAEGLWREQGHQIRCSEGSGTGRPHTGGTPR